MLLLPILTVLSLIIITAFENEETTNMNCVMPAELQLTLTCSFLFYFRPDWGVTTHACILQ